MKMTVITSSDGSIIGFGRSQDDAQARDADSGVRGGVMAGPGQRMQEVDVPDELAAIENGADLHSRLRKHLEKRKTK